MNKSLFDRLDITTFLMSIFIMACGLTAIYSATFENNTASDYFIKQMTFAGIGLGVMLTIAFLPPRFIRMSSYFFYGITIILLIAVLFFGRTINGNQSWFYIGGFGIQPSEFAKIATIMALATFLSRENSRRGSEKSLKDFVLASLIVLLPFGLILKQHDTGTALVFLSFIIPVFFWAGLSPYWIFAAIAPVIIAGIAFIGGTFYFIGGVILIAVILYFLFRDQKIWINAAVLLLCIAAGLSTEIAFSKLQPYQQRRIMAVFDPTTDPLGSGYNVIQSKVAIGSGGLWGKGFLQGTQTQLKFIPEQWTDFIFCMVGEEFGFIGAILVLLFYCVLIFQLINNAYLSRNNFLAYCCIGFASILLFHITVNVGMTIGLMPVIGIPLPLMSYGVSSLLSFMVMIGIAMNTYRNKNLAE